MFILTLARRLLGYVELCIRGEGCERLLNLCARAGLDLWEIRRRGETVTLRLSPREEKTLRELAGRVDCQVEQLRKVGLLHDLYKYRRRKVFLLLAAAFFVVLYMASQVVWAVYIVGESSVDQQAMLEYLKGRGLYVGARLDSIDTSSVESAVILDHDQLVYCGITRRGTEVYVDLRERSHIAPKVELDEPCNLVASRDGQITRMQVMLGDKMVQLGEAVREGQLLASGVLDSTITGYRLVHAFGEVYARTYYSKRCWQELTITERIPNGNTTQRVDVSIFGLQLNFSKISGIPYAKYDKMRKVENLRLLGKTLPVTIQRTLYEEVVEQPRTLTQEEASQRLLERARSDFAEEHPGVQILQEEISYEISPDGVTGVIQWECEENIARQQPLAVAEGPEQAP